jgi:Na+/H+ antiporter NhaD/arsenite permease-like protein
MDPVVVGVFALVYVGMFLGELPGLRLDRTGIALLGAIALVATGRTSLADAWTAVDPSTIALLLGLMVVSAQFRLGGFYSMITRRLGAGDHAPSGLLMLVIVTSATLSAVLANDIVCLAMAPVLVEICTHRRLAPVPYLLALALAANVGSAATLIGNPQNMLIGQTLNLSFPEYLFAGGIPALLGLVVIWAVVGGRYRGRWQSAMPPVDADSPAFDAWQTVKGAFITLVIVAAFVLTDWPRDVVALTGAGILLVSRQMASREMLGLVDWHLLVLFIGLFVVNHALAQSGVAGSMLTAARMTGIDLTQPSLLFAAAATLSNLVSNVPAVMLLLPVAQDSLDGAILALSSTLAGNLVIVGSIANIIVVDQAARLGVTIDWRTHARVGIPITLLTLAIAAAWLAVVATLRAS